MIEFTSLVTLKIASSDRECSSSFSSRQENLTFSWPEKPDLGKLDDFSTSNKRALIFGFIEAFLLGRVADFFNRTGEKEVEFEDVASLSSDNDKSVASTAEDASTWKYWDYKISSSTHARIKSFLNFCTKNYITCLIANSLYILKLLKPEKWWTVATIWDLVGK